MLLSNLSLLWPISFIGAGFLFTSASLLVEAGQLAPSPNAVDSTIDLTKNSFAINTDPLSNGGNLNLASDLTLTNSSGSILNELVPNLNNYGGLDQFWQSRPTFSTVPDSLELTNTSSIDSDLQSHANQLEWLVHLSIWGFAAIIIFWHSSTKRGPKCGYCRKPVRLTHKNARVTKFICLNCGKTFLLPSI